MQNKDKNYRKKIILLAIFATVLSFQFIGITYSLISLYVEQRYASSISDSLQQEKSISANQTNKFVQTFLNLVKSGKIAFHDTGDSIKIAQIVQKGVPSKLGNNDIRNATKGAEILSETKDGQQALERAGISPNGKKFQEGHGVYEDTILPNNSNVKIAEGEIPIVNKEQYSAGEAKYLTRLEDAQKQQIQDSSLEFARWTKENVSQEGVIAGSLVPPIMAKAEKIEVLNSSGEVVRTITPSESTKNAFMEAITRNPKDADILIQSGSKEAGTLASREIAVKDLPEGARSAFATGQETVKLDVIQTDRPISLWKVTTSDGESHLVPAIDNALASKTLMAPTSNLYSNKAMKFNSDFETLWNTAKASGYSDEELFDTTKKMFKNHLESNDSAELAKNIDGLLERNSISPQLKDWLKKVREDPELFLEKTASEGESSLKATGLGTAAGLAAIGWGDNDSSMASTETPTVAEPRPEESIMSSIPYTPGDELIVPTDSDLAGIPGATGGSEISPTLSWKNGMYAAERTLGFGTTELPIGLAGMGWMAGLGTTVVAPFIAPEVLTATAVAGGTLMAADGIKKMVDDPTILRDLPGFVWQDMKDAYDTITDPKATNRGDQSGAPEAIVPPSQEKIITDDPGSFIRSEQKTISEGYNQSLENYKQAEQDYSNALKEYDNGNLGEQKLSEARENFRNAGSKYEEESQKYDANTKVFDAYNNGLMSDKQAEDLQNQIASGEITPEQVGNQLASIQSQQTTEQPAPGEIVNDSAGETRTFTQNDRGELVDQNGNPAPAMYASNNTDSVSDAGSVGSASRSDKGLFGRMSDGIKSYVQGVAENFGFRRPDGNSINGKDPISHEGLRKINEDVDIIDKPDTPDKQTENTEEPKAYQVVDGKLVDKNGNEAPTMYADNNKGITDINSTPSDSSNPATSMPNMLGNNPETKEPEGFWEKTKSALTDAWGKITGESPPPAVEDKVITADSKFTSESVQNPVFPNTSSEGDNVLHEGDKGYVYGPEDLTRKMDIGMNLLKQAESEGWKSLTLKPDEQGNLWIKKEAQDSSIKDDLLGKFSETEKQELLDKYQQWTESQGIENRLITNNNELPSESRAGEENATGNSWWDRVTENLYDSSGYRFTEEEGNRMAALPAVPTDPKSFWDQKENMYSNWPFSSETPPVSNNTDTNPLPPILNIPIDQQSASILTQKPFDFNQNFENLGNQVYKPKKDMIRTMYCFDQRTGDTKLYPDFQARLKEKGFPGAETKIELPDGEELSEAFKDEINRYENSNQKDKKSRDEIVKDENTTTVPEDTQINNADGKSEKADEGGEEIKSGSGETITTSAQRSEEISGSDSICKD